ncbi:MAG: fibronectin type III domain-containing protein [Weeksellaceae bacterium]|nr:fibronectin type III domain-containing protein [Weeksellaceae bacterium]
MKNFYYFPRVTWLQIASKTLIVLLLAFVQNLNAQCPSGNLDFSTQSELIEFQANYPNCTNFPNSIRLSGAYNILSLEPLSGITQVQGDLLIENISSVEDFNGLHNITQVGGDFSVFQQQSSLAGLNSLQHVGGNFIIEQSTLPQNLQGFESLQSVGGCLIIAENIDLTNLTGLENLESVGGGIAIAYNHYLSDISALEGVSFTNNSCQNYGSVTGLYIIQNSVLSTCHINSFCSYLAEDSAQNPRFIGNNGANCTEVNLMLACNLPLPDCPEMPMDFPQFFTSQAQIDMFQQLYPNCTELPYLYLVNFEVNDDPITDLTPFSNIQSLEIGLFVVQTSLENLNGLQNLQNIGNLFIITNPMLTSLDGLQNIQNIDQLFILTNPMLTSLEGLSPNLTLSSFVVSSNSNLSDISALDNATFVANPPVTMEGITMNISQNPQLSVCSSPFVCSILALDPEEYLYDISDNATGCQSIAIVQEQCASVPEVCETPFNLSASDITSNSMQISWDAPEGQIMWQLFVVPQGQVPTPYDVIYSLEPTFLVENLQPATSYDIYVQAMCTEVLWSDLIMVTATTEDQADDQCNSPSANTLSWQVMTPYRVLFDVSNAKPGQRYDMAARKGSDFVPLNSNFGMNNLAMPYLRTSLHASSEYYFYIRTHSISDMECPWVGPFVVNTPAANAMARAVTVYPNPGKDIVNINGVTPKEVRVFHANGMKMGSLPVKDGQVAVQHLPAGSYNLVIVDAEGKEHPVSFIKK